MLRLGKGMLKQKGPMLEETDFSQILFLFLFFWLLLCGGSYLKKIRLGYVQADFIL